MKLGPQSVSLKALIRRGWLATEMRVQLNTRKIEQYALEMREGHKFPDPVAFIDPKTESIRVGDGFHRIMATKYNHEKAMTIDLRRGGYREAFMYCIEANRKQLGLPLTTGDKARCITTLIRDEETSKWTLSKIAEFVGCTVGYVSTVNNNLKKIGVERPNVIFDRNGVPRTLPIDKDRKKVQKRKSQALTMLQEGVAKIEIGRKLGISRSAVQRYIKDAMEEQTLVPCPHCGGTGMIKAPSQSA